MINNKVKICGKRHTKAITKQRVKQLLVVTIIIIIDYSFFNGMFFYKRNILDQSLNR